MQKSSFSKIFFNVDDKTMNISVLCHDIESRSERMLFHELGDLIAKIQRMAFITVGMSMRILVRPLLPSMVDISYAK